MTHVFARHIYNKIKNISNTNIIVISPEVYVTELRNFPGVFLKCVN